MTSRLLTLVSALAAFGLISRAFAHEMPTAPPSAKTTKFPARTGATKPQPPNPNTRFVWENLPRDLGELAQVKGAHDARIQLSLVGDPTVFFVTRDAKASPYLALKSQDGGDTFRLTPVAPKGEALMSHGENSPVIARQGMLALWQRTTPQGSDIVFASSSNFGHSYATPAALNNAPGKAYYAGASTNAGAQMCVAWLDSRDPEGHANDTASIYSTISNDGGKTWTTNTRVAQNVCPCCRPTTWISGNTVVVMWRSVTKDNIRDIVSARSVDGGQSWGAPVRVGADHWMLAGCPDTGPQLVSSGNDLYTAWYSGGDPEPGIRVSISHNQGTTWSKPVLVSKSVLDASQPSLSVNARGQVVLAMRARPNRGDGFEPPRLYFGVVLPSGAVTLESVPGSEGATQPRVSFDETGRVYTVWNADDSVWMQRGRLKQGSYFCNWR